MKINDTCLREWLTEWVYRLINQVYHVLIFQKYCINNVCVVSTCVHWHVHILDAPCVGANLHTYQCVYGVFYSSEAGSFIWTQSLLISQSLRIACPRSSLSPLLKLWDKGTSTHAHLLYRCLGSCTESSAQLLSHDYFQMYLGRNGFAQ